MNLPPAIERARREIETHARRFGLDFYDVVFEVLDYDQLNEVAAYGGFPTRYPHWRFGMEYEELAKGYTWGLSKIYELVINNNPVYAYLMKANASVEQKLVMAHVFGHADFFKNNLWFSKTNRRMIDAMANHATRVRSYIDRHGVEAVEDFIDACLSLENLIDYHSHFIERQDRRSAPLAQAEEEAPARVPRLRSKSYMEPYINPPSFLEEQKARIQERARRKRMVPAEPQRDAMQFLIDQAPLENWERDVLAIVREEAYYFAPQAMTKILNEGWACLDGDALVFTDRGLLTMRELAAAGSGAVSDGETVRAVYDRHVLPARETVTVRTRRGLRLRGSASHRVLMADRATWKRLDELAAGDRLAVSGGAGLWATKPVAITGRQAAAVAPAPAARLGAWVALRRQAQRRGARPVEIAAALSAYDEPAGRSATEARRTAPLPLPTQLDEPLAALLGFLAAQGRIDRTTGAVRLATADVERAWAVVALIERLFGVRARVGRRGGRWRLSVRSGPLAALLSEVLGPAAGSDTGSRPVPPAVLRSPEPVVRAFVRACFDCRGRVGRTGPELRTRSERLAEELQLLLLNWGVLADRRERAGRWTLAVEPGSARLFAERVGSSLASRQAALTAWLGARPDEASRDWRDEVVGLERGHGDVYDVSVAVTHRYAAAGFLNHNSYWHSTIMTQRALTDSEVVDFADHHSGALAMTPGRINPYKIGIELFREIEDRWNKGKFGKEYDECDDLEAKRRWDRKLGLGRQKIFEVRKIYNDVMFVDAFMNEEFCHRLKLYVYAYDTRSGRYVVADRDWRKVKERLLFTLTNLGQPIVHVVEANWANRGELYLKHRHEGVPLDLEKARDTLRNLHRIWRRPVHLETVEDDRGRLLSYDGSEHKTTRL